MASWLQCAPMQVLPGKDARVCGKLRAKAAPFSPFSPFSRSKFVAGSGAAPTSTASAALPSESVAWIQQLLSQEPKNALSLPTWTIHVASVVEWVVAMILVWQYGDTKNNSAWKGLSWAMVPLLGGALCACTWHFFYNAESLEVLVVMQGALTLVGNITLWIAAYRIYQSSRNKSSSSSSSSSS